MNPLVNEPPPSFDEAVQPSYMGNISLKKEEIGHESFSNHRILSTAIIKDIALQEEHQAKVILLLDNLLLKVH